MKYYVIIFRGGLMGSTQMMSVVSVYNINSTLEPAHMCHTEANVARKRPDIDRAYLFDPDVGVPAAPFWVKPEEWQEGGDELVHAKIALVKMLKEQAATKS